MSVSVSVSVCLCVCVCVCTGMVRTHADLCRSLLPARPPETIAAVVSKAGPFFVFDSHPRSRLGFPVRVAGPCHEHHVALLTGGVPNGV